MMVCARSWGQGHGHTWRFCTLERGHAGNCISASQEKDATALFFEEQPLAIAALEKQRLDEQKAIARKRKKSGVDFLQ